MIGASNLGVAVVGRVYLAGGGVFPQQQLLGGLRHNPTKVLHHCHRSASATALLYPVSALSRRTLGFQRGGRSGDGQNNLAPVAFGRQRAGLVELLSGLGVALRGGGHRRRRAGLGEVAVAFNRSEFVFQTINLNPAADDLKLYILNHSNTDKDN